MIAAFIGGGVVVLAVLSYAWWATAAVRSAEQATRGALVGQEQLKSDLRAMTADRDAHRARSDYQEKRANALDAELDIVADDGDPVRARGRVLARLSAAETADPAHGDSTGAVPGGEPQPDPAVAGVIGDALIPPGG